MSYMWEKVCNQAQSELTPKSSLWRKVIWMSCLWKKNLNRKLKCKNTKWMSMRNNMEDEMIWLNFINMDFENSLNFYLQWKNYVKRFSQMSCYWSMQEHTTLRNLNLWNLRKIPSRSTFGKSFKNAYSFQLCMFIMW